MTGNDMKKQIVYIFGASGSGTTTLAAKLRDMLGYYLIDTDDYLWEPTDPPYTTKRTGQERFRLMKSDIGLHGSVVISGSLTGWGDGLIPDLTLAVRVETETAVRIERLRKREHARFGARIEEGGDMYDIHRALIEWASAYDHAGHEIRSKAMHDEWQKRLTCPLITVDGSRPPEENLKLIEAALDPAQS
jgi:adenylate kinase family enzyme